MIKPVKDSTSMNYNLLDMQDIQNSRDTRLTILRKVQSRTTSEGKPFIRLLVEDVHGYLVVARMFNCESVKDLGTRLNTLVGKLVLITYDVDYYKGSACLIPYTVQGISDDEALQYQEYFAGKYSAADAKLRLCNTLLVTRNMSESLNSFRNTYCNLDELITLSDESICKGLRGYILDILHKVLVVSSDISDDTIVAFLTAIMMKFYTKREADASQDENRMFFIASMMDKKLLAAASGLTGLSYKIAEFAALFSGDAHIISAESFMMYNLYTTLAETSNIQALESQLLPDCTCTYKKYTIRRS